MNQPIPDAAQHDVISGFPIGIVFPEKVITQEQIERTQREIEKSRKELAGLDTKLANDQFVRNAPPAVVQGAQARQIELRARLEKLEKNQSRP